MNLFDVILAKLEHDTPMVTDRVELARLAYWGRTLDATCSPRLAAIYGARSYGLRMRASA